LKKQGLATDTSGGGDVSILPQDNAATLDAFKIDAIDGAWVPEPWATRLIQDGGGKVLVAESDLWPGGKYVTTQLVVATKFLSDHPDVVKHLLEGQVAANDFVNANPADAQKLANDQIEKLTQKRLSDALIAASWKNLTFTNDPIASSLQTSADAATDVGLLDKVDLKGIYDLTLLNEVLKAAGEAPVSSPP
jgi:NitT/TauT family transport system substrate-binding protein